MLLRNINTSRGQTLLVKVHFRTALLKLTTTKSLRFFIYEIKYATNLPKKSDILCDPV